MIDLEAIKQGADLLAICESDTTLKLVASTGGGEYAGPCPFCGGKDRFRVEPKAPGGGRWMCHYCTQSKWQDVLAYIARRDGLDLKKVDDLAEACKRANGGVLTASSVSHRKPIETPAYTPPAGAWQKNARQAVQVCQENLWKPIGAAALEYLRARGLRDETIKKFNLGYSPGADFGGLYVSRGVVIPAEVGGVIWYLKIRLLPGIPCKCQSCKAELPGPGTCPSCGAGNKYRGVKGNKTNAIYNADKLTGADVVLFCEGEFDCMIAEQELDGLLPVATLGSATNRPDLATWGRYLRPLKTVMMTYDADAAGEAGALAMVELTGSRAVLALLPEGVKDINDYHLAGGDLFSLFMHYADFYRGK